MEQQQELPCRHCECETIKGHCLNARCPGYEGLYEEMAAFDEGIGNFFQRLTGRHDRYRLRGRKPIPCGLFQFGLGLEYGERDVGETTIGPYWISTKFIGMRQTPVEREPPLVFETALFEEGEFVAVIERYSSWEEAESGHEKAVEVVRKQVDSDNAVYDHDKNR